MNNKLGNIKERILYLAEYQEGNKQTFFKKIGMSYGNFTGKNKLTPINSNAIENILANYPNTNPIWLITGEGNMIAKQNEYLSDVDLKYGSGEAEKESPSRLGSKFTSRVIEQLELIRNSPGYDLNALCKKIDVSRQSYLKWIKEQSGLTRKNYNKIIEAFPHIAKAVNSYTYSQQLESSTDFNENISQLINQKIIEMPMQDMRNYKLVLTIEFKPITDTNLTPII